MLKKIIAAVLSVLTALCLALPAFAVRNINDTDSTYESTTAGAGLRESEPQKYTSPSTVSTTMRSTMKSCSPSLHWAMMARSIP